MCFPPRYKFSAEYSHGQCFLITCVQLFLAISISQLISSSQQIYGASMSVLIEGNWSISCPKSPSQQVEDSTLKLSSLTQHVERRVLYVTLFSEVVTKLVKMYFGPGSWGTRRKYASICIIFSLLNYIYVCVCITYVCVCVFV